MPALEDFKIKSLPATAFYIADFITQEEEQRLLDKISAVPKPRWKQLTRRRLQTWPSDLLSKDILIDSPLPDWLQSAVATLLSYKNDHGHIFEDSPHRAPNHVLINEYLPGQGIMPHKDGSAYHNVVCTVSLGSSLCLDIYGSKEDGTTEALPRWKILQEPRSLLVTTDKLYTDYLHGIAETTEEIGLGPSTVSNWDMLRSTDDFINGDFQRQTRTSLTYRDVVKVSKLAMFGKR